MEYLHIHVYIVEALSIYKRVSAHASKSVIIGNDTFFSVESQREFVRLKRGLFFEAVLDANIKWYASISRLRSQRLWCSCSLLGLFARLSGNAVGFIWCRWLQNTAREFWCVFRLARDEVENAAWRLVHCPRFVDQRPFSLCIPRTGKENLTFEDVDRLVTVQSKPIYRYTRRNI